MKINKSKRAVIISVLLLFATVPGSNNFFNASVRAEKSLGLSLSKGEAPKKDLVSLKVKPSIDLAKVVSNFQQQYPRNIATLIDEAQDTMNDLYRLAGVHGDKSSAFIVLVEQFKAGTGKDPVPLAGDTLHSVKCKQYIVGLKKKAISPLPPEAIERLVAETTKMQEALDWADSYRAGNNPALPKWSKSWKSQLGG